MTIGHSTISITKKFQSSTLSMDFLLPLLDYTMEGCTFLLIFKLDTDSPGKQWLFQK